jgi:hypothetical protein
MDRQAELDLIAAHLADRGVTRCPPRYAETVDLAMPEAEVKARLTAMPRPRPMTHAEVLMIVYARLFPRSARKSQAYSGKSPG